MGKKYCITDGKLYIGLNKDNIQITVGAIDKAQIFDNFDKALNVKSNMKKTLRLKAWEIVKIEDKSVVEEQIEEQYEYRKTIFEDKLFSWDKLVHNIEITYGDLNQYRQNLLHDQRNNEKEICDIYHYIEFMDLNASSGFKAYKMLQERLRDRRRIKDELSKVEFMLQSNHTDLASGKLSRRIEGLNHRQYEPRVLKELFQV